MKKLLAFILTLAIVTLTVCSGVTAFAASTDSQPNMTLGTINDGVYSNEYAGIACALDEHWVYYSAEDLQALPENVRELFSDSELADQIADSTVIADMQAENAEELLSVNVNFTKLGIQERLAYSLLSEEDAVDVLLSQKDLLTNTYAQAGITVSSMEKVTVTFLGEDHFAVKTQATLRVSDMELPYFVLQIMDYKLGGYGMTLTATSYVEDSTQSILDLFYALDN